MDARRAASKLGIDVSVSGGVRYADLLMLSRMTELKWCSDGSCPNRSWFINRGRRSDQASTGALRWSKYMIPVLSAAQMRQLDEETIEAAKIPGRALMELAADGVVRRLEALQEQHHTEPSVFVLVGSGNNGGDGLVVARRLYVRGWKVERSVEACSVIQGRC